MNILDIMEETEDPRQEKMENQYPLMEKVLELAEVRARLVLDLPDNNAFLSS